MIRPDRAALEAMVAFLKANLVKTVGTGPGAYLALAETAVRFNDTSWFWTDDNAKAAELLCEPRLYNADPATADAAIDFVLRMSQGEVIQRRCGPAELRVLNSDPSSFRMETAFFIVEGDLTRGIVRHALRFNDGRTVTAAQHTGNSVSFRHDGRNVVLDVEEAITATRVQAEGRTVLLSHTSTLREPVSWRRRSAAALGTLIYTYAVSADRPSIGLHVELAPAPGATLHDVVLTTAIDQLSIVPGVAYRGVAVRGEGGNQFVRNVADGRVEVAAGPAEYSAIVQEGASPGFSYAIHSLLTDGAKLAGIFARGQQGGKLHWVTHRYRVGAISAPTSIREERMLTGGGYYDALAHYAAVLRDAPGGGEADPSMTYDIGAELNAVAVHVLFARGGQYARSPAPARLAQLTAWYDRHAARYFEFIDPDAEDALDRVFTRGIAFVAMSLDCMLRASGHARYHAWLTMAVRLILRLQSRASCGRDADDALFADTWAEHRPFLDNHAACVLALARAAWHGDADGALGRAVHEGILGIRLYTGTVLLNAEHAEAYDGLAVLSRPDRPAHADTGFWNFKLGMVMRALQAVRNAAASGVIAASAQERERLRQRLELAQCLIDESIREQGDGLEVLTSRIAGETNSETQPWVALGLVPVIDELVVRLGHRGPPDPR